MINDDLFQSYLDKGYHIYVSLEWSLISFTYRVVVQDLLSKIGPANF
jgi:hypothetical protein